MTPPTTARPDVGILIWAEYARPGSQVPASRVQRADESGTGLELREILWDRGLVLRRAGSVYELASSD